MSVERCRVCGRDQPSKYYFSAHGVCSKCFEGLSGHERQAALAEPWPERPTEPVARGLSTLAQVVLWALASGAVGLGCGYIGNEIQARAPGSVAPLIGLFFTGPGFAGMGAALGFILSRTKIPLGLKGLMLAVWLLVVGKVCWTLTEPGFEPKAELVDGQITGCTELSTVLGERLRHWRGEADRVSREFGSARIRADWESHATEMFSKRQGVLLTLEITRTGWVRERAWSSGRVDRDVDTLAGASRREEVFLDAESGNCQAASAKPVSGPYLLCFEHSGEFPPTRLPEYLDVSVIHQVPKPFAAEFGRGRNELLLRWVGETCSEKAAPQP